MSIPAANIDLTRLGDAMSLNLRLELPSRTAKKVKSISRTFIIQETTTLVHCEITAMADSYSIESPVTLFPLSSSGQKQAGSSYSISGGKKRKRTEIVLGNDGESVNIYDVCSMLLCYLTSAYRVVDQSASSRTLIRHSSSSTADSSAMLSLLKVNHVEVLLQIYLRRTCQRAAIKAPGDTLILIYSNKGTDVISNRCRIETT